MVGAIKHAYRSCWNVHSEQICMPMKNLRRGFCPPQFTANNPFYFFCEQWFATSFHAPSSFAQVSVQITDRLRCWPWYTSS